MTTYELLLWIHLLACIGMTLRAMRKFAVEGDLYAGVPFEKIPFKEQSRRRLQPLGIGMTLGMVSLLYALTEAEGATIGGAQAATLVGLFAFETLGAVSFARLRADRIQLIFAIPLLLGVMIVSAKLREVEEDGRAIARSVRELRSDSATGLEPDKLYLLRGANRFEPLVVAGRTFHVPRIEVGYAIIDNEGYRTRFSRTFEAKRTISGVPLSPRFHVGALELRQPVSITDSQLAVVEKAYRGDTSEAIARGWVEEFPVLANHTSVFRRDADDSFVVTMRGIGAGGDSERIADLDLQVPEIETMCALGRFDGSQLVPFQIGDVAYGGLFHDSLSLDDIIGQANLERRNTWISLRFLLEMALFYLVGILVFPGIWPKRPILAALAGLVLVGGVLLLVHTP